MGNQFEKFVIPRVEIVNETVDRLNFVPIQPVQDILIRQKEPMAVFLQKPENIFYIGFLPHALNVDQQHATVEIAFGLRNAESELVEFRRHLDGRRMFGCDEITVAEIGLVKLRRRIDRHDVGVEIQHAIDIFRQKPVCDQAIIHFFRIVAEYDRVGEQSGVDRDGVKPVPFAFHEPLEFADILIRYAGMHEIDGERLVRMVDEHRLEHHPESREIVGVERDQKIEHGKAIPPETTAICVNGPVLSIPKPVIGRQAPDAKTAVETNTPMTKQRYHQRSKSTPDSIRTIRGGIMNRLPIIASVTREEQIPLAVAGTVSRVNLMAGEIGRLASVVKRLHDAGKRVFVHLEMVAGLGRDASGIAYLAETFGVDGIVTTKSQAVVAAKQIGLPCIQRIFAIDTAALQTAFRMIKTADPDEVELMPGLMPRIIREAKSVVGRPLIVGGLIRRPEEIEAAFASGADFVSIGHPSFWNL